MLNFHKMLVLVVATILHLQSVSSTLDNKSPARSSLVEPLFSYDEYGIHQEASKSKQSSPVDLAQQTDSKSPAGPQQIKSVVLSSLPYTSSSLYRSPFALLNLSEEPIQQPKKEEPHHWSALENYYEKLRSSQTPKALLRSPFDQHAVEHPIMDYWNIRQEPIDDQRLASLKLLAPPPPPPYYPILKVVPTGSPSQKHLLLPPLVDSEQEKLTQQQILTTQQLLFPAHQQTQQQYDYPGFYNRHFSWIDPIQRPLDKLLVEEGRSESSWRRRLPELLQLRQLQEQQLRVKHQLATFGSWYDYQRTRELLQEEAYCGPRNYLGAHSSTRQSNSGTPSDYPSHIGIYNESSYLCAGTWISESFVLTVASCVSGLEPHRLLVNFNEWNTYHQESNVTQMWASLPLPKPATVDQIHIFPKFRESREHNLALLRLAIPVDYMASAYVVPACQPQARSLVQASSCWTPIRNSTRALYFDATGDGETREKLVVKMVEKPVKLVVRDEQECKRSTGSELFNFQHPNFICSADVKRNEWRLRLNTTDAFGSGIYCEEGGRLTLVSLIHPARVDQPSSSGYLDLSYYKPWMRNIISEQI